MRASSRLFNIALCHVRLGHRDEALSYLERYQSADDADEYRNSEHISRVRESIAEQPERISPEDRDSLAQALHRAHELAVNELLVEQAPYTDEVEFTEDEVVTASAPSATPSGVPFHCGRSRSTLPRPRFGLLILREPSFSSWISVQPCAPQAEPASRLRL